MSSFLPELCTYVATSSERVVGPQLQRPHFTGLTVHATRLDVRRGMGRWKDARTKNTNEQK